MNLETSLEPRMWETVRASLEARRFTSSVLDAIHLLSDVIRERSGLEGDGVSLIGAAFGGTSPKLKVNKLQTDSEQSVQKGIEALLRGMYQAIRNPRSHGVHEDSERDAVAILLFLDYLLREVDRSRSPFSLPTFVGTVLDPHFVAKDRYAGLLVDRIPEKQRLAACREVFSRRDEGDAAKLRYFFAAILVKLPPTELDELAQLVSEELCNTTDESTVQFVLGAFPAEFWSKLDETARLRSENRLISSVRDGRWDRKKNRCSAGAFGTWARNILQQLTLKDDLWGAVIAGLYSSEPSVQDYSLKWFASDLASALPKPPPRLVRLVVERLKNGDERFRSMVSSWDFIMDLEPEHPWRKPFVTALSEFTPATEVVAGVDDEIPF